MLRCCGIFVHCVKIHCLIGLAKMANSEAGTVSAISRDRKRQEELRGRRPQETQKGNRIFKVEK